MCCTGRGKPKIEESKASEEDPGRLRPYINKLKSGFTKPCISVLKPKLMRSKASVNNSVHVIPKASNMLSEQAKV